MIAERTALYAQLLNEGAPMSTDNKKRIDE